MRRKWVVVDNYRNLSIHIDVLGGDSLWKVPKEGRIRIVTEVKLNVPSGKETACASEPTFRDSRLKNGISTYDERIIRRVKR